MLRSLARLTLIVLTFTALSSCRTQVESRPSLPSDGAGLVVAPFTLGIFAFNDLHGNLAPPQATVPVQHNGHTHQVPAGGAAYLAGAIRDFKQRYPAHLVVSAGDMVSASPLLSSLFLDEPTIHAVNAMGIDFNAVGNHEFDRGAAELLRLQHGGCEVFTLREPCQVRGHFAGANFTFLGANVQRLGESGNPNQPLLPPTGIKTFVHEGRTIRVGVIGITTRETATSVNQSGIRGLEFLDEIDAANRAAASLGHTGTHLQVLVIHEGGKTNLAPLEAGCSGLNGRIVPILEGLDSRIKVVISGHTHQAYNCQYTRADGHQLLLTSAGEKGMIFTEIAVTIAPNSGKMLALSATNQVVQSDAFERAGQTIAPLPTLPSWPQDSAVADIINEYQAAAQTLATRVVGAAAQSFTRTLNAHGESHLGQLVADAQLYVANRDSSTRADFSVTNNGGLRADLTPSSDGQLRFADIYAVQPFGNRLVTLTLSGAQIRQLLEEQFNSGTNTLASPRILQVSRGLRYTADLTRLAGQRILDVLINDEALVDSQMYRVATHSYLAEGGDNFKTLSQAQARAWGVEDLEGFEVFLREQSPLAQAFGDRIQVIRP